MHVCHHIFLGFTRGKFRLLNLSFSSIKYIEHIMIHIFKINIHTSQDLHFCLAFRLFYSVCRPLELKYKCYKFLYIFIIGIFKYIKILSNFNADCLHFHFSGNIFFLKTDYFFCIILVFATPN